MSKLTSISYNWRPGGRCVRSQRQQSQYDAAMSRAERDYHEPRKSAQPIPEMRGIFARPTRSTEGKE
jgi:hypothetical protein